MKRFFEKYWWTILVGGIVTVSILKYDVIKGWFTKDKGTPTPPTPPAGGVKSMIVSNPSTGGIARVTYASYN